MVFYLTYKITELQAVLREVIDRPEPPLSGPTAIPGNRQPLKRKAKTLFEQQQPVENRCGQRFILSRRSAGAAPDGASTTRTAWR
jgi:hypothetical protein